MHNIIVQLSECKIIKKLDIIKSVDDKDIQIFQAKAVLINDSLLYIYKLITKDKDKYAYHWQTKTGKLIIRWDNSPHYPQIETQPHHKHIGTQNKIEFSYKTDLKSVLNIIAKQIA